MNTIELSIEIVAPLSTIRSAMITREGFRGWLAADTRVDGAGRYTFSFAPREVTFTLDRADDHGVEMTCVHELNNPDWLGTKLAILLTPIGPGRTRVELSHSGYSTKNECYSQCVKGWDHFLKSLALYATTGSGLPFDTAVNGPAPARAAAEVAS